MYVITGATGNTGKVVAERLLAEGRKVRVVGRNAEKLQPCAAPAEFGGDEFAESIDGRFFAAG